MSWLNDLLLETGLGDAEHQLINEDKKEYKYVITKNNFKLLQNQVSSLEQENKSLKAKVVEIFNDNYKLKEQVSSLSLELNDLNTEFHKLEKEFSDFEVAITKKGRIR